uniref:porin family protein n=1 Tax=Alistipes onderdonkii TaxID=328813 RepID=UPI00402A0A50
MMKPLHNETDAAALPSRNLGRHLLRCCAFCLALAVSVPASAQWRVGLTAGYSRNTLDMDTGYAYDLRYEARDGFTVGIPVQYDFRDWFGLRADLVFVQKGQKMHRTDTYNAIHTDTRNNYLQLPVMASFSFGGERLRGFLNAGGYVGGWLSSHRKGVTHRFFSDESGDENGVVVPENRYEFDEKVPFDSRRDNRFEAGLVGGVGVSYRVAPRVELQAEGRCYYALTDMQKDYMKFRVPRYNTTFVVQVGCSIILGKTDK